MRSFLLTFLLSALMTNVFSQTAMKLSSSSAEKVLSGKYNPAPYQSTLSSPAQLTKDLYDNISPDSLKADIIKLASFGNRNSGSDTVSSARGIGAARRWIYGKFAEYAKKQNSRLIPSYLYFKLDMCGMPEHKDILAVLPGSDTSSHEIIIIEGHVDSRCEDNCDTGCVAQGVEDNASGTALVMELARVMSGHNYPHTIVFLVTTGEEQGLYGAKALADYLKQQKIPVKGVLNNDVIGGVICGHTSSPPSCPGYGDIDSTHVRIFSSGGYNSPSKGLARFTKLEYEEMLMPLMKVPMEVLLMTPEDRRPWR